MYEFRIIDNFHRFSRYTDHDLDCGERDSGVIVSRLFVRTQAPGGLYLEVELMPQATYTAAPIEREKINRDGTLAVNRVTVRAGDPSGSLAIELASNPGLLRGATIGLRRYYLGLDAALLSSYRPLFRGFVTNFSADYAGNLSIEVSDRWFDWSSSVNKRNYTKNCSKRFKGTRCRYVGVAIWCDKTLPCCENLNNAANFGGFLETADLTFKGVRGV